MVTLITKFLVLFIAIAPFTSVALGDADIRLIDPWVRATPPGAKVTGGFMTLQNDGKTDDVLLSVSSPSADVVEIHQTLEQDGMMQMQKIDKLPIKAGQAVALQPGGYHLMLIGMRDSKEIKANWITLILKFEKSGEMEFKAPLRTTARQATKVKTSKKG